MPKIVISRDDLPAVSKDGSLTIRIRSTDPSGKATSVWSPIYTLVLPYHGDKVVKNAVQAVIYHSRIGSSEPPNYNIHVSWHDPNNLGVYDIFTRWKTSEGWTGWEYLDTQFTRNISFNPPLYLSPTEGFLAYGVSVCRPNQQKTYSQIFSILSTPEDGISLV